MNAELMELKIPTGWAMCYNRLYDVDMEINSEGDIENWEYFTQDLMQIIRMEVQDGEWCIGAPHILIDIGWVPDGEVDGSYRVKIVINPGWEKVVTFKEQTRHGVKALLEDLLDNDIFIHPFNNVPKPVDIEKEVQRFRRYIDDYYV